MPELYQTILVNFGLTIYIGESLEMAEEEAKNAGFETVILLDGGHYKSYSPISGWKN